MASSPKRWPGISISTCPNDKSRAFLLCRLRACAQRCVQARHRQMPTMNWESLDWEILDRLRDNFLSGTAAAGGPYWHTLTDLECYDFTYGERIGWKWDAVLHELKLRHWAPPPGATVLDWGCGSGIAGPRGVEFLGAANGARLLVHDHSRSEERRVGKECRSRWSPYH